MTSIFSQFSKDLLSNIIAHAGDGIVVTDSNRKIIAANDALSRLTGYTLKEMMGKNPRMFASGEMKQSFYKKMMANIHADGVWHGEFINRKKDGTLFYACETITAITDDSGEITHYVGITRDNTAVRKVEKELQEMAFKDELTGIYNRRYFFEYLETQISHLARSKTSYAIVTMDLDNFSMINNTYGHTFGDDLLASIASRLTNIFSRKSDVIARLGGDEFIAIISDIGKEPDAIHDTCEKFAKKLIRSLSQPHKIDEFNFKATASIGIAYVNMGNPEIKEIIRQSDSAMYRGKKAGKNTYKIYPVI